MNRPNTRFYKRKLEEVVYETVSNPSEVGDSETEFEDYKEVKEEKTIMAARQRTLVDFAKPSASGIASSITRPPITTANFELRHSTIQMVQNAGQFEGKDDDNPVHHVQVFLEICDSVQHQGVTADAIRLRLFPFSLRGRAKSWLDSQAPGTFTTWDDLAQAFVEEY
ncbi:unnamed protein product [Linum trigynum]|uniref:Retrotransposon gag domain-containing protein n=1 Tax=Linum trigynum TaxID=586398 RepID=A0AAV2EKI9_9ROSI